MYIYGKCVNVERIFARNTRQSHRFNFRVDNYQSTKYKNSSYFKGIILWDRLPVGVIGLPTILEFKRDIKKRFSPCNDNICFNTEIVFFVMYMTLSFYV